MSEPVLTPTVRIGGADLAPKYVAELMGLRIERGLCVVGRATLRIGDWDLTAIEDDKFRMGTAFQCRVGRDVIFSGEITGINVEHRYGEVPELVVVAHDCAHRLSRDTTAVTYKNVSYTDVLRTICQKNRLTLSGSADSTTFPYVLQTGTPLSMLDAIAQRTNHVWWCDDQKIVVQPATKGVGEVGKTWADDLIEWSVRTTALRPTEVNVTGWDMDRQHAIEAKTSTATGPDAPLARASVNGAAKLGMATISSPTLSTVTSGEAQVVAAGMLQKVVGESAVARGMCRGDAAITPGVSLKVQGTGATSGTYVISEVEHVHSRRGFFTKFVAGPVRAMSLVDAIGAPAPSAGFTFAGVVVGIVTDNNDTQGGYGRVKVKFPMLGSEIESEWARVATPGGGTNYGAVFQFEIGDEVLVGFEGGDTRRPVVLGGLYSKKVTLPEATSIVDRASSKVNFRRITSRAGNCIEFCEGGSTNAPKKHVALKVGKDTNNLLLSEDEFVLEVAEGDPVTVKAGSTSIEVARNGDVKIQAPNITLQAQQAIKLDAMQIEVKAKTQLTAEGTTVGVKAKAIAEVEGAAVLKLKGGMVNIN